MQYFDLYAFPFIFPGFHLGSFLTTLMASLSYSGAKPRITFMFFTLPFSSMVHTMMIRIFFWMREGFFGHRRWSWMYCFNAIGPPGNSGNSSGRLQINLVDVESDRVASCLICCAFVGKLNVNATRQIMMKVKCGWCISCIKWGLDTCHILLLPLVLRLYHFLRISDDEGVERDETGRKIQKLLHPLITVLEWIEGCPYGSKMQALCHQENVLCGSRAILNPKLLLLAF